ncbi:FemAB family XrtA/PEP-CTERM system-associated protein [Sphingomonas sp. LaA6.9]|uniref:FemAB family XrtA/PEP-CTERM system-associated protein n=1 Tax=Sphingomonas sp. LaA6.9 TaxID=2919914 RepID=UPI001F4FE09D|nr:FemAB family XrtA/PEP-CTERM system-associated protein [Sphingomonas sp. LaA6.9]MCJ8157328.1 FemAB family PEP-CTERM system-associated protein [Sphingomonas sp. LaA6.9]
MTLPVAHPLTGVRVADLGDAAECARIDAMVGAHAGGTPFHLTGWSRAVQRGCGQHARYLIAEDAAGGLKGVLPLTELRSALFGNALVSVGFGVGGGIVAENGAVTEALARGAWELAQKLGCASVELRGGSLPGDEWPRSDGVYAGFARALAADDEAELLAIPRKQRAEVRRAQGFDLIVEIGTTRRDRDAHYRVYAESVRNLGTPVFPRALFDAVLDDFGPAADILTVRHRGRAIASVLSLYVDGTVMPYWGGGTAEARRWRANDLMYYALMRHARARGCTRFDFGRSKVGTGAFAFKKNWGFVPEPLNYATRTADGATPRSVNPLDPRYRLKIALWQRLPLALANRIGPYIARGLG